MNKELIINEHDEGKWQEFATVRAEVGAMSAKLSSEIFSPMQVMDNAIYRFKIRFIESVKNNMRIRYNNKHFQVKHIINQQEKNLVLLIIAQETL